MQNFKAIQVATACMEQLAKSGFRLSATEDVVEAVEFATSLKGKPGITAPLSPELSTFTRGNLFWIMLEREGKPAGCVGARLDDLKDEPVGKFWQRELKRLFPDYDEIELNLSPNISQVLTGKVAYIGDLYFERDARGGRTLFFFAGLLHAMISVQWTDVNCSYSFMRFNDVASGQGFRCGFTMQYPSPKTWPKTPPPKRYLDEVLCILPSSDADLIFKSYLRQSNAEIEDKSRA